MALSIETILTDAHKLVIRLKEHDAAADCLVARTQSLQKQLDAMKQFQEYVNELNEAARHRPRIGLIIALAQENSKIRELQQENKELRQSLDEHQSALELIMSKYREQVNRLVKANSIERSLLQQSVDQSQDLKVKSEKIGEMAAIMNRATAIDIQRTGNSQQLIKDLEFENRLMRQLLQIDSDSNVTLKDLGGADGRQAATPASDVEIQTDELDSDQSVSGGNDESPFCTATCSTVVRNTGRSAASSDSTSNPPSLSSQDADPLPCGVVDQSHPDSDAVEHRRGRPDEPPSSSAGVQSANDEDDETLKRRYSRNLTESAAGVVTDAAADAAVDAEDKSCGAGKSWLQDNCNCSNNNDDAAAGDSSEDHLNDNDKVTSDGELNDTKRAVLSSAVTSHVDVTVVDNGVIDKCFAASTTTTSGSENVAFGVS